MLACGLGVVGAPLASARTERVALEDVRSIKLDLIERLEHSPDILINGSSRGRYAEPAYLRKLTGRTGFNAAVTGGGAPEAWVMTRCLADRFPAKKRRYLWFVSVGIAGDTINPQLTADPRGRKYLSTTGRRCRDQRRAGASAVTRYLPDGSVNPSSFRNVPDRVERLQRSIDKLVASIRANPPTPAPPRMYFERTLAYMNRHGARPVLVLKPVHPTVLAELERYGYPGQRAALEYLGGLRERFDFVLVDCHDISRWGGSPDDFTSATHVNRTNMRRMLVYIVAHSEGAFR